MFLKNNIKISLYRALRRGPILPKVFCPKISDILANSAILGTPFVLRAYITGIFIGPEILAPLYII
jgi:hypothetical protein